jgi:zinc protease
MNMSRPSRFACMIAMCVALPVLVSGNAQAVDIQRVISPGGIEAWLVHDATVPIISVNFAFKGGAALDPKGKEGLADMVSGLLDEGAGELDSRAYQAALKDISASISFDAGSDRFRGSMRTLSKYRDEAFRLLRLAVTKPRFDAEPVERIRSQLIAGLLAGLENPRRIARRTWYKTVFPNHPYGRPVGGVRETVESLTVSDLRGFVARRIARAGLVIGAVGDISAGELARRLDEVFGALPDKPSSADLPEAAVSGQGKLVVIRKPIPQSIVIFGQNGVKRDDPDYYTTYVLNHILGGGGFSSRLTEEIREKRGLVYSVYSYLNPMARGALVMGGLGSQNARVAKAIDIVRSEWRRISEHGVTPEELKSAKTYINGSFPLRLDSSSRIARMLVAIQAHKLGIDYLDRRQELINSVTGEGIRRVARRLFDAQKLTVVVVGNPKGLENSPD